MISYVGKYLVAIENRVGGEVAGIIYSIIATITFFITFVIGKIMKHELTISQMVVSRGVLMFIILVYLAKVQGHAFYPESKYEEKIRMIRSTVGSLSLFFPMLLINYLPLSEISMIGMLGSNLLCFADYIVNKSPLVPREVGGAVISFLGVIMILKPEYTNHLFFGYPPIDPTIETQTEYATGTLRMALILGFAIWSFGWALSIAILKKVKNMSSITINLPSGIVMSLAAGISSIMEEEIMQPNWVIYTIIMIIGGAGGAFGLLALTRSNQIGKQGMNGVISNVNIVYTLLFDMYYLKEPFNPSSFTGALIIVVTTVTLSVMKMRDAEKH